MFIVEMSENHGYSYAFYCWRKSSKMKYIKVGSLLVLCWQTFFDPENRKLDSFRGSLYPVTKYLERGAFFPRRKILQLCTDKIINCPQKFISPAAF